MRINELSFDTFVGTKIKPCFQCGISSTSRGHAGNGWFIHCTGCGITANATCEEDVIFAWNTRQRPKDKVMKHCPVCKIETPRSVEYYSLASALFVMCQRCGCRGPLAISPERATELWSGSDWLPLMNISVDKPKVDPNKQYKFWLVWTPGLGAQNPKYRHDTYLSAQVEAERLAKFNTGQEFYVAEIVGKAKIERVLYLELRECKPVDVPF